MVIKRKDPNKMPRCGYVTTTGFWTTQDRWEVDDSEYVTIYDVNDKAYARVLRYEEAKTLGVEKYRKNIPDVAWYHLAGRAIFALDPFRDGTPIEKAKKIPRELMPFVKAHVEVRERKKAAKKLKAERDAARARGELPPRKPREARKAKKAG